MKIMRVFAYCLLTVRIFAPNVGLSKQHGVQSMTPETAQANLDVIAEIKADISERMEFKATMLDSWEAPKGLQFKHDIAIVLEMVDEAFHDVISEAKKVLEKYDDGYESDNRTHPGNC